MPTNGLAPASANLDFVAVEIDGNGLCTGFSLFYPNMTAAKAVWNAGLGASSEAGEIKDLDSGGLHDQMHRNAAAIWGIPTSQTLTTDHQHWVDPKGGTVGGGTLMNLFKKIGLTKQETGTLLNGLDA